MKNFDKKKILILTIIAVAAVFGIVKLTSANDIEKNPLDAGYNLQVVDMGSYSGPYVEDASDVEVSDCMMIKVKNNSGKSVQYGEVQMIGEDGEMATFKFSTLKPEQTLTVLESTKKGYNKRAKYNQAIARSVAYFQNEPYCYNDKVQIQLLNGGINITNVSKKDITDEIAIYYKDKVDGEIFGGITYRGKVQGGLKAGEIRQLMSSNISEENTEIVFVTINGR